METLSLILSCLCSIDLYNPKYSIMGMLNQIPGIYQHHELNMLMIHQTIDERADEANFKLGCKIHDLRNKYHCLGWDYGKFERIVNLEDLRRCIDEITHPWLKDTFLDQSLLICGIIKIQLIIEQENWHWRFVLYHEVANALDRLLPMPLSYRLECIELVPSRYESVRSWNSKAKAHGYFGRKFSYYKN